VSYPPPLCLRHWRRRLLPEVRPFGVNTSYSVQVPVSGETDTQFTDQEKSLKRSMYERAARECDDLKATIALTCQITSINVSTQITRNPGTPSQVYVSANVQMQVTVK